MPGSEVQEVGRVLHQARLRKSVSLLEAQQATKIRQSFLAALEEDDYSILPPPVYIRGFIKNYSNYLGLNGEEMVQRFDNLVEEATTNYDFYSTRPGYGSSDSGGAAPLNPQMLIGLSEGEARLVERSSERINLTPLTPTDDTEINGDGRVEESRALIPVSKIQGLASLRVPEKYVLRPAIQPINKPAFFLPNFIPILIVLIIVGAAFLLLYRGLALPPSDDTSNVPTITPNVYSKATVTPFVVGEVGNESSNSTTTVVANATVGKVPSYSTPEPTQVNAAQAPPIITPQGTQATQASSLKIEISADGGQSWLIVTVDGQEKYNKMLTDGQAAVFEGKRISVKAGVPGVIQVKVNGQVKPYAPDATNLVTHTWDVSGEDSIK